MLWVPVLVPAVLMSRLCMPCRTCSRSSNGGTGVCDTHCPGEPSKPGAGIVGATGGTPWKAWLSNASSKAPQDPSPFSWVCKSCRRCLMSSFKEAMTELSTVPSSADEEAGSSNCTSATNLLLLAFALSRSTSLCKRDARHEAAATSTSRMRRRSSSCLLCILSSWTWRSRRSSSFVARAALSSASRVLLSCSVKPRSKSLNFALSMAMSCMQDSSISRWP
mmetsp:Transcript_28664/g.78791  ORF Transcript_28664/g.78791 Transcript_28664/m.78791 type:complete len:221 (-) Transcript_28664:1546-2208(-)